MRKCHSNMQRPDSQDPQNRGLDGLQSGKEQIGNKLFPFVGLFQGNGLTLAQGNENMAGD